MSKCKITGKVLGIQLGREETRIALMGKGSEILHSVTLDTPAGAVDDGMIVNTDALRDMLKSVLKTPEFKGVRQAVFTLSTSQIIAETVTTPDLPASKLEKLLHANVDMYFPMDMKDYKLTWQVIGPKSKSELKELAVQLWAVPNQMLPRYYALGNACGLSVAAVDYCGSSIATAVGASFARTGKAAKTRKKLDLNADISFGKKKEKELEPAASVAVETQGNPDTDLHMTLEKDLLGMTFVQNGQVVYQRFIRCGADPSYQLGELAMMVEYFQAMECGRGSRIHGIVSGALSGDRELVRDLSDVLGISVDLLNSDFDPEYVLCAGAARTTLDFGTPALNKPGKARRELQQQLWQYALILVGGLVLISVIMLTLSSRLVWSSSIGRLETTRQSLTVQAQKTNGFADNYHSYEAKYDAYSQDWDTVFSSLRTYNDNLVLVLEELEGMLPENTSITNLGITPNGMNVGFACATKEEAAYLIMALRELQYADLLGITDLQGGGVGPATSYGSGEEEAPPTEGGSSRSAIGDLVSSELSEDELTEVAMSLNQQQIQLLGKKYGAKAPAINDSLAQLKDASSYDEQPFSKEREDALALRQMLTTNPFAAERFADMLINEDFDRGADSILMMHIMLDIIKLQQSGGLDTNGDLMGSMNALVDILVKDETTLLKTEELLKTDPSMEAWYVYYLEVELDIQPARDMVFLDQDKLVADLMDNGEFNTGDAALDAKLNGLISDETRNLVLTLNNEQEMSKMMDAYLTKGTTGNAAIDEVIGQYLTNGTTGSKPVDEKIGAYLAGGAADQQLSDMFARYLVSGTTGNKAIDKRLSRYLTKGTSGIKDLDTAFDKVVSSGAHDAQMQEMTENCVLKGTSGNEAFDALVKNYENNGTSGNKKLDAKLEVFMASVVKPTDPTEPVATEPKPTEPKPTEPKPTEPKPTEPKPTEPVVTEPKPTEPVVTEPKPTDPKPTEPVVTEPKPTEPKPTEPKPTEPKPTEPKPTDPQPTEPQLPGGILGNLTEDDLKQMAIQYMNTGSTGNPVVDMVLNKYKNEGTTGNAALDAKLEPYKDFINGKKPDLDIPGLDDKPLDEVIGSLDVLQLGQIVSTYLEVGTTGNDALDKMMASYFETGSSGSETLDKMLTEFVADGYASSELADLLLEYMTKGSTGNAALDKMFARYFETGTTGNPELDKVFDSFLGDKAPDKKPTDPTDPSAPTDPTDPNAPTDPTEPTKPGDTTPDKFLDDYTDTELKTLAVKYKLYGSSGNKLIDALFKKYADNGTTGVAEWDKRLAPLKDYIAKPKPNDPSVDDALGKLENANGGGSGSGPADTRIFFNAMLGYNNQLINSELNRKGLDYADKIEKLEVED